MPQQLIEVQIPQAELFEAVQAGEIDKEAGIIRNVTILGRIQRRHPLDLAVDANALPLRIYSDQALADGARLVNGAQFYLDHPPMGNVQERSVRDLGGEFVGPKVVGDFVRADLHLLDIKETRERVFAIAQAKMKKGPGMSHRALAEVTVDDQGVEQVESLLTVQGVDLVTEPGTTSGLWESMQAKSEQEDSTMTLAELKEKHPELITALAAENDSAEALRTALAELKTVKGSLEAKKREADNLKATAALEALNGYRTTKQTDAKLPEAVLTDGWKKQLSEATTKAAVDALIAERQDLVKRVGGKPAAPVIPASVEGTVNVTEGVEAVTPEKIAEYALLMQTG